ECLFQTLLVAEDVDVLGHRFLEFRADFGVLDALVLFEKRLDTFAFGFERALDGLVHSNDRTAIGRFATVGGHIVVTGIDRARRDGRVEVLGADARRWPGFDLRWFHLLAGGVTASTRA